MCKITCWVNEYVSLYVQFGVSKCKKEGMQCICTFHSVLCQRLKACMLWEVCLEDSLGCSVSHRFDLLPGRGLHTGQLRERKNIPFWEAEGVCVELQHPSVHAAGSWLDAEGENGCAPVQQLCVHRATIVGLEKPGFIPRSGQLHELHRPRHLHHLRHRKRHAAAGAGNASRQRQGRGADDRRGRPPPQPWCYCSCSGGQRSRHKAVCCWLIRHRPAKSE